MLVLKQSTNCNFLTSQRIRRLCSPAKTSSLALHHIPILPLTEKPKEPISNIVQDDRTW